MQVALTVVNKIWHNLCALFLPQLWDRLSKYRLCLILADVSHLSSVMGLSLNTVNISLLLSCKPVIQIYFYCKSIIQENPGFRILFETKPCGLGRSCSPTPPNLVFIILVRTKKVLLYSWLLLLKSQMWRIIGVFPPAPWFSSCISFPVCCYDNTLLTGSYWSEVFYLFFISHSFPWKSACIL